MLPSGLSRDVWGISMPGAGLCILMYAIPREVPASVIAQPPLSAVEPLLPAYPGGSGVGVLGPNLLYCWSITARTAWSGLPSACMAITSRVMFRQMSQVAP